MVWIQNTAVYLHPVLIETTSKNNNKQARARRLLRLGVVLDWIAFMKLLGVETAEGWKCWGEKEIKFISQFPWQWQKEVVFLHPVSEGTRRETSNKRILGSEFIKFFERYRVRNNKPPKNLNTLGCRIKQTFYNGEFDPGSGWTLAAGLIHASRGRLLDSSDMKPAHGCVTRMQPTFNWGIAQRNLN